MSHDGTYRIVTDHDAPDYLASGWLYVCRLSPYSVLMRAPICIGGAPCLAS